MKYVKISLLMSLLCFYTYIGDIYAETGKTSLVSLKQDAYQKIDVKENQNRTIYLAATANGTLANLPLKFSIVDYPSNGKVDPNHANILKGKSNDYIIVVKYTPNTNYTGPDGFTYKFTAINIPPTNVSFATNTRPNSDVGKIDIVVNPPNSKLFFVAPPLQRAGLAFILSLIIVFLIFLLAYVIIRKTRSKQKKKYKPKFWDIVRDENWYPSLAIFQFLLWTSIVLFAYVGVYLARLFSGSVPLLGIPTNLFAVMGISAGVTIANQFVSQFKYGDTTPPKTPATKQGPPEDVRKRLPGYKTMIMENDKITLPRFQMFAWTWIGILSYLFVLFLAIGRSLGSLEAVNLPELPLIFVSLMGLSQLTYQVVKATKPAILYTINEVRPRKIQLQGENNLLTILGSNFGNKGTMWIEYYQPFTDQEKITSGYEEEYADEYMYDPMRLKEQIKVDPEVGGWEESRIVARLDSIKEKLKLQSYVIRVEKDGLVTYPTSDAMIEITELPIRKKDLDFKLSCLKSEIKVNEKTEIRADVTKNDATYADKVEVDFDVSNINIAGFNDNVSNTVSTKKVTDANGLANVSLIAKSKGNAIVKASVKLDSEVIEQSVNIKVD